jgi:polygalacturonase
MFRLPSGFQASSHFTHIHQIKAGDDPAASGAPIVTLSVYSGGNPNVVRLIYQDGSTLASTDSKPFENVWVVAKEVIKVGTSGQYSLTIKTLKGGKTLLSYSNKNLDVFPSGAGFIRPKWGIYRSLLEQGALRDEQIHFNNFCIAKAPATCPTAAAAKENPASSEAPESQTIATDSSARDLSGTPRSVEEAGGSSTDAAHFRALHGFTDPATSGASGLPAGAADFTILTASGASSVDPGNPYPYAVWVSPVNGFTGTVSFQVTGLPVGATGTFRTADSINPLGASVPTRINGGPAEATLTVSTSPTTSQGSYTLTIIAKSGSLTHTATATLTVNPPLRTFPVSCGGSDDTAAVNRAVAAANSAGGGIVEIPAHAICSTASIHLMSHVRLQLDAGSEIRARSGIDAPESLGCTAHQDTGHSHFHDALIWGENITDVGLQGSGTLTGNGVLVTGTPGSGQGDKILSLKNVSEITITGITFTDGGHFGILANGTSNLSVSNIKILDSHNRDAFNLINSSHAVIDDSDIEGSDDAMVMKGDSALCTRGNNDSTFVSNSLILSTQNNATQFGSETCSNFTNFWWGNLNLTASGKAGIGITSNDGAIIDGLTYDNIHITNAADPIYMKVDDQARCPGAPPPGFIRNVHISNVNATVSETGSTGTFTNTINGFDNPANHISSVTITNTQYVAPGGGSASDASTNPPENNDWTPKSLGTRPSYGWFVRHADDITFINTSVKFSKNDGRPAFVADDGSNITLDGFVFGVGSRSPYDLGFININGFHVDTGTVSTTGAAARIHETGSTPN